MTNALDTVLITESNTASASLDLGAAAATEQAPETTATADGSLLRGSPLPLTWAKSERRLAVLRRTQTRRARTSRGRIDWYALGVVLLMLASAALCVYRLLWAIS